MTQQSDQLIFQFAISAFCDGNRVVGSHVMFRVVLDIKPEISFALEENIKSVQRIAWDRKNWPNRRLIESAKQLNPVQNGEELTGLIAAQNVVLAIKWDQQCVN